MIDEYVIAAIKKIVACENKDCHGCLYFEQPDCNGMDTFKEFLEELKEKEERSSDLH